MLKWLFNEVTQIEVVDFGTVWYRGPVTPFVGLTVACTSVSQPSGTVGPLHLL